MTRARYLIRVDDICEGLNLYNFNKIIKIFNDFEIEPIIAVVPENKDIKLKFPGSVYGENFWKLIKKLQDDCNWKVGIHGYQHKYITKKSGLLKINKFSEFAGLNYADQMLKLEKSIMIMKQYNLSTDLFIAPGHSFDKNTLKALVNVGFKSICDGFFSNPGKDKNGLFWIPQQLWDFKFKKKGIWTVNLHINTWDENNFNVLIDNLKKYQSSIVNYEYVKENYINKKLNIFDFLRNYFEINKNSLISFLVKVKSVF